MRAFRVKVTVRKTVWQSVKADSEEEAIKIAVARTEGQVQKGDKKAWPEFTAQTLVEFAETGLH